MRRISALAMVLALVAVACRIETNVVADLNADGTGTVMFEVGFDEEAQGLFLADANPFDQAPPGATTSEETRDGIRYFQFTSSFSNAEELTQLMLESDQAPFESFSASFSENSVKIDARTGAEGGGFFDEGDLEGFSPDQLEDSLAANIVITMPGKVISSTADSADGSTLSWSVPIFSGGTLAVQAESDPTQDADGGGGFPAWLIAVTVVVVAAGAFLFMRSRKSAPAAAPSEEPEAAAPSEEPEAPAEDEPPAPPAPSGE
ncbi:MAG TPA: hypothetical protein VLD62_07820 [Acidimicrobiia bacterium]|nr:hypothetical protein [Acidimicrobiia bacterium]